MYCKCSKECTQKEFIATLVLKDYMSSLWYSISKISKPFE